LFIVTWPERFFDPASGEARYGENCSAGSVNSFLVKTRIDLPDGE
jgi:hypothetical protein